MRKRLMRAKPTMPLNLTPMMTGSRKKGSLSFLACQTAVTMSFMASNKLEQLLFLNNFLSS